MNRREFLKFGTYGIAALAMGSSVMTPKIFRSMASAAVLENTPLRLMMQDVLAEMVDRTVVNMWAFADDIHGPRIPGTVLFAEEGQTLDIILSNNMDEQHAFAIPGVVGSGALEPGQTIRLTFPAPEAGTYMYLDPLNTPVNRVMGLHGTLVVLPGAGNTPYSRPTSQVQSLFDALGTKGNTPDIFPGDPWTADRTRIWMFNTIDPKKNDLVKNQPAGTVIDQARFTSNYLPRYFTISGRTGFFSSHDPLIFPHGNIGQPLLLRLLNAGLATHSPHIHGNHVYELSKNGEIFDNVILLDTWTMEPGTVKDLLLPFIQPPDAYPWPPSNIREFPMPFAMHCHTEMSQTAAAGNYPQGLITDWEITSPQVGGPEASEEEFPFFRGMDPALFK